MTMITLKVSKEFYVQCPNCNLFYRKNYKYKYFDREDNIINNQVWCYFLYLLHCVMCTDVWFCQLHWKKPKAVLDET
jgi:hypothetical protein